MTETGSPPEPPTPHRHAPAKRRRIVVWICVPLAVILAGLFAVLALTKPASQALQTSALLGKPAPTLRARAILNGPPSGAQVTLAAYKGCWVLVNFAASWCIPCHQEMPQLKRFAADHAGSGDATIITVAYDQNDLAHLRSFQESWHVTWPVVDQAQAVVDWGVGQIPVSYLVDPQGTVAAQVNGPADAAGLNRIIDRYPQMPCLPAGS